MKILSYLSILAFWVACLIQIFPIFPVYAKGVYYYSNPVSLVCSISTDGVIYENTVADATSTVAYRATRVQLGATVYSITQYIWRMTDAGADTGNVRISLYIDDTDGATTDMPYTEIANSNVSVPMSDVGASAEDITATLSSLLTGVTGTIWMVNKEENSANRTTSRRSSLATGQRTCYSTTGAIDSWTCTDATAETVKLMGCAE